MQPKSSEATDFGSPVGFRTRIIRQRRNIRCLIIASTARARMKTRIPALTTALALCCPAVFADTTAKPGITPVQAELTADLNAHLMKVGSTVFARVTVDWRSSDCVLRNGAILEAHVVSVVPQPRPPKIPRWVWPLPGRNAGSGRWATSSCSCRDGGSSAE